MTRRFEFEEGGSSKFWQVSVSGSDMTVDYGRIGTSGQSKTKSFASPEAAQKEADALIKEKTKKGYREVGGGAAPTPSATPAKAKASRPAPSAPAPSAPAPSAPAPSGPADDAPGGLRCAIPAWAAADAEPSIDARRRPGKPKDFAALWGSLNGEGTFWSWPSEGLPARARPRFGAFEERVVPAEWDRELEAYALVLVRSHSTQWGEALTERALEILEHWASRKDPVEALRTWMRSAQILCRPIDAGIVVVPFSVIEQPAWREEELAAVRAFVRSEGRDKLEAVLRAELPNVLRTPEAAGAYLGWLLDDPEEARKCLPTGTSFVRQVIGILDRAEDVTQTLEACAQFPLAVKAPAVLRAIGRHGIAIADAVLAQCERVLDYRGAQVADKKPWIAVAACYPSARAATLLVRMLEDKANRKAVGEALANMPREAVAALEPERGKKIKHKDVVEALLSTLTPLAAAPKVAASAAPAPSAPSPAAHAPKHAAPPAAAPSGPSTVIDGARVVFAMSPQALAEIEPGLDVPLKPRKAGTFDGVWSSAFAQIAQRTAGPHGWKWGEGETPEESALLAKARQRYETKTEEAGPFDRELEAYCLALANRAPPWPRESTSTGQRALAYWTSKVGPEEALRTFLRSDYYEIWRGDARNIRAITYAVVTMGAHEPHAVREHLRAHGRDTLAPIVRELVGQKASCAWILEDVALAEQAVNEEPDQQYGAYAAITGLLSAERAAARLPNAPLGDALLAVKRHGLALAPAVLALSPTSKEKEHALLWSCYPSAPAATKLVAALEAKSTRKLVSDLLAAMPEHAVPALDQALTRKLKYKDVVEALRATLASATHATTTAATPEAEEADPSALPPVLKAPPWHQKKRTKLEPIPGLSPQPVPETLDLSAIDPKVLQRESHPRQTPMSASAILEAASAGRKSSVWFLMHGTLETWLEVQQAGQLGMVEVEYWTHDSYTPGLTLLLHQHGLGIVPVLLELAPRLQPALAAELEHVGSVSVAPHAIGWLAKKSARRSATIWARRFPRHAAAGLLPIALGAEPKSAERAMQLLGLLRHERAVVLEEAARLGANVVTATEALLDRDPLESAPAKAPKLFDGLEHLPRITLKDGRALPVGAQTLVLEMLAFSPPDAPYAGLEQVKEACDAASLDTFVEALVRAWVAGGQVSSHEWAVRAVATIGSDRAARFLFDRGRAWGNDNQKQRAMLALDVLGAMGSDLALSLVGRVSRSGQRQYLKDRAVEILAEVAEQRGLSADELEDRTAPDLGLDEHGTMALDFGTRKFVVGFDEHLVPFVKTEAGERLDALPRVSKTDDAAQAKAAWETWKALRAEAEKVAKDQIARLERMLADERTIEADVFESAFVRHPLIGHLTRRLVWGAFDRKGALLETFRVAEDGSLATVDEATFVLPDGARVGLMHPIRLNDVPDRPSGDLTARWGQVLSDYAILQPFPQLARPTEIIDAAALVGRYSGKHSTAGLLFSLRSGGWRPSFAEYADVEGFLKQVGSVLYRLVIRPPIAQQGTGGGPRPESHTITLVATTDAAEAAPTPVQVAEVAYQLDAIVLR